MGSSKDFSRDSGDDVAEVGADDTLREHGKEDGQTVEEEEQMEEQFATDFTSIFISIDLLYSRQIVRSTEIR